MLLYSNLLDFLLLFNLFFILFLIIYGYLITSNSNNLKTILTKIFPIKNINWFNNKINTSTEVIKKYVLIMIILFILLSVLFLLLKFYISIDLLTNLDTYINVHNFIHGK